MSTLYIEIVNQGVMIKFENPTNGRYYYLVMQKDLLNDYVLVVYRGGNNGLAFNRTIAVGNAICLQTHIEKIRRIRLQRGYIVVK